MNVRGNGEGDGGLDGSGHTSRVQVRAGQDLELHTVGSPGVDLSLEAADGSSAPVHGGEAVRQQVLTFLSDIGVQSGHFDRDLLEGSQLENGISDYLEETNNVPHPLPRGFLGNGAKLLPGGCR